MSDQTPALAQTAANGDDPAKDEKEIKDYSGSERYKETDLQPGSTTVENFNTDEKVEKDGFKFELLNPSETSPSKTQYGYQITIDKKTGQRTYTRVYVTDSGLVPVPLGEKPMMGQGDKLTPGSPGVTFKPNENGEVTAGGRQRNYNYEASAETLKHLNNKDNDSTSFGMKDNYSKENPGVKYFGNSFVLGYKVNPWPNENDNLEELKFNKNNYDPNKKYFVQGQDIDTGIKVDNIDENAKERLVGQVYNPITGKIVPGASAYIGEDGNIHVKLPAGALKKDENGKTVINEDSIFNTPEFKALQNLDVRFFARPRTAEEFRNIAGTPDGFGATGTYVETGAGTADINHKGTNVTIDKQGIDRYDHYNLIGDFKLNLDDTRYYDQKFEDGNGDDTSKVTSSAVKPGEPFKVGIVEPENPGETDKSADDMNGAESRGEASGKLIMDFINRENEGKAEEDQWKVDLKKGDISNFTITPPKSAKAGDFIAIPIEYTYTNGSKDVHWFHFVVQESSYIRPEYETKVNYPINKQTSPATVPDDTKKIKPDHYTLPDTLETDDAGNKLATDDKGNKWTVTLDETTGQVTAKPVNPDDFDGGEKLTVPVIAHYKDPQKPGEDITEEANAYFVIEEKANMTPRYNAKAGKEGDKLSSDVILNEEDRYNRRPGKFTLDSPTYTDDKGNVWNVSIDEKTGKVTATVPNAEEGKTIDGALLNVPVTAHYYEEDENGNQVEAGTKLTEVQFVAYGTDGTKTHTEKIPFEYDIQYDPDFYENYPDAKDGYKIVTEGVPGEKTTTWTIKDSQIVGEPKVETKDPVNAVIKVGKKDYTGTFITKETKAVDFETEYRVNNELKPGEVKEIQKGELGEEETKVTHTIVNGQVTKSEKGTPTQTKAPVKRIVEVGPGKVEGETTKVVEKDIPFETKIIYDETLEAGSQVIEKDGKLGKKKVTITTKIVDGELVTTEKSEPITEKEDRVVRVGIKPVVKETELGNDTEYRHNPELKEGEKRVIEEGSSGSVKYTTTFNKETGKLEVTEERVEPKNKVVEYGSKTDGEFTYESEKAYDIIIRENPNLEAGKTNVLQEGIVGKTETTVKIENSKEVDRTTKTITEKQDKIIEIGTKNVCEIPPVTPPTPGGGEDPEPGNPGGGDKPEPGNPGGGDKPEPGKPGEKPEPDKPGTEEPGKPGEKPELDKPGTEEPGKLGEKPDPDKPGTEEPGTPDKPEKTGDKDSEKPNEPGTPGEKPSEPGKPGKTPSEETPKTPESPKENNRSGSSSISTKIKEKVANPTTGVGSVAPIVTTMGISIAGILATKKKKEDE